jgi:hypothetical protein
MGFEADTKASTASSKEELIAALEIDPKLCSDENTDKGLILAYAKWKAITEAYKKMQTMIWQGPKPTYATIISLFVSRAMFYSHYKHFNRAAKYPEMVEWLEERPDGPSNMDIWGQDKPYYNFPDLTKWLQMKAEGGDEESSSDDGKKSRKKTSRKMRRSPSPQPSHGKKSHKGKAKSSEMLKKGSKK